MLIPYNGTNLIINQKTGIVKTREGNFITGLLEDADGHFYTCKWKQTSPVDWENPVEIKHYRKTKKESKV